MITIRVTKKNNELLVLKNDQTTFSCKVSFGFNPNGHKETEGDGKTPEGRYILIENTGSKLFKKSFLLSYPNEYDQKIAKIKGKKPGGDILIHGFSENTKKKVKEDIKNHWRYNWTRGCIGVSDEDMDYLYDTISYGTPIEIFP